jgi:alpha-N-arabinofuranosidase
MRSGVRSAFVRREVAASRRCVVLVGLWAALALSASGAKPDLVLYLALEEGKGDTARDTSGNGNDGKLVGNPKWVAGKVGGALEFGGNAYVEVPDKKGSGLDGVPGLTIEAWVRQAAHHDNGIVVKLTTAAFWPCSYNLETWSDANMWFGVDVDAMAVSAAGYPLKEWFHLAGVFDGKQKKQYIFLNGKRVAEGPASVGTVPDGDKPVWIGTVDAVSFPFQGALDEVAIYSRALTDAEIQEDMRGIVLAVRSEAKLATRWAAMRRPR